MAYFAREMYETVSGGEKKAHIVPEGFLLPTDVFKTDGEEAVHPGYYRRVIRAASRIVNGLTTRPLFRSL